MGDLGDLARMKHGSAVAPDHLLDNAALVAIQHRELAAGSARSQVGDDAVAYSGGGVMQGRPLEKLERAAKNGRAGDDDLGALRSDSLDFATPGEVHRADLARELADLLDGGFQAIGFIAAGAGDAIDSAHDGRGGRRRRDRTVEGAGPDAPERSGELLIDVLVHAVQVERTGRIGFEKSLREPYGPKGF